MTADSTETQRVAILVADGFEQVELEVPKKALEAAGFVAEVVSPASGGTVQGFHHMAKGDAFPVDVKLAQAQPERYAALLLPGGVHNPDALRSEPKALEFVRHFFAQGKPVAAICHGPWTLIDAGVAAGRKLTSYASIKNDLRNAGADWSDSVVVVDQGLVTSRSPDDLPAFCKKMVEEFREGPHGGAQRAAGIAKLGEMIKDMRVAMLTTLEHDGTLHSRPMATVNRQFDGTLWFFTAIDSSKSHEVDEHRKVSITYSDLEKNRYIAVSGRARVVKNRQKAEELYTPIVKVYFPRGLEDPDLGLLQIEVERAEYWDSLAHSATGIVGLAKSLLSGRRPSQLETAQGTIALAKSLLSGRPSEPTHETIDLEAVRNRAVTKIEDAAGATQTDAKADESKTQESKTQESKTQESQAPESKTQESKPTSKPAQKPAARSTSAATRRRSK